MINYQDFEKVDIRVGNVVLARPTKEVPLGEKMF